MRVAAPTVFEACEKFKINTARPVPSSPAATRILDVSTDPGPLEQMPVKNTLIYMSSEPASGKA